MDLDEVVLKRKLVDSVLGVKTISKVNITLQSIISVNQNNGQPVSGKERA